MRGYMAGILALMCISCTHTSYLSSGKIPVYIGAREKHAHEVSTEGKKSFFFWGIVPTEHKVYMDKELANSGLVSAANVKIEEYQTWDDFLVSCFSFGMFIKKTFRLKAYGMKADQE